MVRRITPLRLVLGLLRHGRIILGLRGVFQELPEPNRACLVGVYAFLIWNNLCDLVYQTLEPRFSTPTRT